MKKIPLDQYRRRAVLDAFKHREVPVLSVTSLVDITQYKQFADQHACGFFIGISFLVSLAVNRVPEFRHRLIGEELYEFEQVDPGFTVLLDDRTFSFCDARYFPDFTSYKSHAEARVRWVKEHPDLSTGDKHHMFFLTSLPWFSFTSITHPYDKQYGCIPIISLGKFFSQQERLLMPVGVQVHHGLVDGLHIGMFYEHLSALCRMPEAWLT